MYINPGEILDLRDLDQMRSITKSVPVLRPPPSKPPKTPISTAFGGNSLNSQNDPFASLKPLIPNNNSPGKNILIFLYFIEMRMILICCSCLLNAYNAICN